MGQHVFEFLTVSVHLLTKYVTGAKLKNHKTLIRWRSYKKHETKRFFKELVETQFNKSAFTYLQEKQQRGSKGRSIKYTCLRMQDYLLPQAIISLKDQREIFSIRCKTNPLGANRGIIEYCETKCGAVIDNAHIF